jgi:hypothetical protein
METVIVALLGSQTEILYGSILFSQSDTNKCPFISFRARVLPVKTLVQHFVALWKQERPAPSYYYAPQTPCT